MIRHIPIEEGAVDVHLGKPVRRRIDIVLEAEHRCPEAIIRSKPEDISLVISQCELNGGHDGNHIATTAHGTAEWPRFEPRGWPDESAPF